MTNKVRIAGVGMIPFTKPGRSEDWDVMAEKAARLALKDAGIDYALVEQAYVGYVYGDSTAGQSALYRVGLTGIPIINVNNNCATGSTALYLARQLVELGGAECVLVLGFEQMVPGALGMVFNDRKMVMESPSRALKEIQGIDPALPPAAQLFG
ncbi:MAG: lipid-transfer protein, partial [Polaromonas sp.]|nr:lipid-transfer protein [Polaromonas sp.]